ncbi:hypothetical protein AB0E83_23370 [Streptomyces sp. NPDC035033]|uniref:hypothetical protein n=1 Tax=Streptomyces sp. NPDC035033 TaxID=3155368 RepID=UPI0033D6E5B4
MTSAGEQVPEIGDLVRDQARGCDAVVTDTDTDGRPVLRFRYGSGPTWTSAPGALGIIARRGNWAQP